MVRSIPLAASLLLTLLAGNAANGQSGWNATTLVSFNNRTGEAPAAPVTRNNTGVLFGSTSFGGSGPCYGGFGCGTLFALLPPTATHGWLFDKLYDFQGGADGTGSLNPLTAAPDGTVYGLADGTSGFMLYGLVPQAGGKGWSFQLLFNFAPGDPNFTLTASPLVWHDGALYGVANGGSQACDPPYGCGSVYRLTPPNGTHGWQFETVWAFTGSADGGEPVWIVAAPTGGALYVATDMGGGTVQRVAQSAGLWRARPIASFGSASLPGYPSNLVLGDDGTVFGTASPPDGGTGSLVFHLLPRAGGQSWINEAIALIHDGANSLNAGPAGTLVGVNTGDVDTFPGDVFQLSAPTSGTAWTNQVIWNFQDGPDRNPLNAIAADEANVAVILFGGDSDGGSVVELTPPATAH